MKNQLMLVILLPLLQLAPEYAYAKSDFFNQSYRGWLWFEEKEQENVDDLKQEALDNSHTPTKEEMQQATEKTKNIQEAYTALRDL